MSKVKIVRCARTCARIYESSNGDYDTVFYSGATGAMAATFIPRSFSKRLQSLAT